MISNLQRKIANMARPIKEQSEPSLVQKSSPNGFKIDSFRNKTNMDLLALSYFEQELPTIQENLQEAYNNLKGICQELGISAGKSQFELSYSENNQVNLQESLKQKLTNHLNVNFIQPFNNNKIYTEHKDEIFSIIESTTLGDNVEVIDDVDNELIVYAIFEQAMTEFITHIVIRPELDKFIQESIKSTRPDYFETFENNFKDKYELILENAESISFELAPKIYKKINAVSGDKPTKIVRGISKFLKE